MKKSMMVVAVIVSSICVMPLGAEETAVAGEQPTKACQQCVNKKSLFQSAARSIETCRPNVWLLKPMNPLDPITKEKVSFFQRLADSMHKRCPDAATTRCKTCGS